MNSTPPCSQKDFPFNPTAPTAKPVVLQLQGIEVQFTEKIKGKIIQRILRGIPSFKTQKTAFAWKDSLTGQIMARPLTRPEHRKWMDLATLNLQSQLNSALGITAEKIRTVCSPRAWIASLVPYDDSWSWLTEISVKSRLCQPGEQEGAVITITRLQ